MIRNLQGRESGSRGRQRIIYIINCRVDPALPSDCGGGSSPPVGLLFIHMETYKREKVLYFTK